jgi:hypothetical protein
MINKKLNSQKGIRQVRIARLKILWARAQEIRRNDGMMKLFRNSILFLISPVYERTSFYLYEYHVNKDESLNVTQFKLKMNGLIFKVVSSNQQADKLELDDYIFRSYPTDFNYGLTIYSQWLAKGAIAFCTFMGYDFAAITWVIPSQHTQDKIGTLPLKIAYSNHEAFSRGTWVNPKYRKLGLYGFTRNNRDKFLTNMGINVLRTTVDFRNKTGMDLQRVIGSKKYGRAQLVRILFWRFWEETPDSRLM